MLMHTDTSTIVHEHVPNSYMHEEEHGLAFEDAQKSNQRIHLVYWHALPDRVALVPF